MNRSAHITADGSLRFSLRRWWSDAPRVAWLMLNPSKADGEVDDPTVLRTVHFSRKLGGGGLVVVNVIPWRATDPSEMLASMKRGEVPVESFSANLRYIREASAEAEFHVVAFGVPHPSLMFNVRQALDAFNPGERRFYCLGTSPAGWPLHPLARGKFAVRNEVEPMPWTRP